MAEHLRGYDALVLPERFVLGDAALATPFTSDELDAMQRYLWLAEEIRRCRYFTEEERGMSFTMDQGVTTSFGLTLPDDGATRDMLALLRQLFGDGHRGSFASMIGLLRAHVDSTSADGQQLLDALQRYELVKQGVLDSWDVQPGGAEHSPHPPLTVFLDWMYGEYVHSDADKAKRIKELDGDHGTYKWQFHWVTERLSVLFTRFTEIVGQAARRFTSGSAAS